MVERVKSDYGINILHIFNSFAILANSKISTLNGQFIFKIKPSWRKT
jgi:hypothetical protein